MSDREDNQNESADLAAREPQVCSATVPAWPLVLLVVLLWWGMRYFEAQGGAFNNDVYYANLGTPPPVLGMSPEQEAVAKGKVAYLTYCAACHQPHGKGVPGQFPPLAGSDWVNGVGPNRIVRLVLDGVAGPITVNGQQYSNAMVPWRPMLNDEQIAWIISYIRNEAEWGNAGSFVTAAEVKAIRGATSAHAGTPYNADELLSVPDSN
jgi:mono/diheme cytochrome c family protein